MGLDWDACCRGFVQFLLDYHSVCSLECYTEFPFHSEALSEVNFDWLLSELSLVTASD